MFKQKRKNPSWKNELYFSCLILCFEGLVRRNEVASARAISVIEATWFIALGKSLWVWCPQTVGKITGVGRRAGETRKVHLVSEDKMINH